MCTSHHSHRTTFEFVIDEFDCISIPVCRWYKMKKKINRNSTNKEPSTNFYKLFVYSIKPGIDLGLYILYLFVVFFSLLAFTFFYFCLFRYAFCYFLLDVKICITMLTDSAHCIVLNRPGGCYCNYVVIILESKRVTSNVAST